MPKLSIIVIGGGIGGLASALALKQAGHEVTVSDMFSVQETLDCHLHILFLFKVFEKYSFSGEVGAAVGLTSNTINYLQGLGFDTTRAKLCRGESNPLRKCLATL